jgi:hypothetical protein
MSNLKKDDIQALINTRNMLKLTEPHSYDDVFYGNPVTTLFNCENITQINHSREYIALKPETNVDFNNTITFKIPKSFDILEHCHIQFSLPYWFSREVTEKLAKGELRYANETNDRFEYCNGIGYYLFDNIELRIGGKEIQTITPEVLHLYHKYRASENTNRSIRATSHGYFDNPICYNQNVNLMSNYNNIYSVKLPFFFSLSETSKLLVSGLRDRDCEIIFRIRPLEKILYNPKNRNKLCELEEPFGRNIRLVDANNTSTTYLARGKEELVIEDFELLLSSIYLPTYYRKYITDMTHKKPVTLYQTITSSIETARVISNSIQIPIEANGFGRYVYLFARLKENTDFNEYSNLSRSTNTDILSSSRAFPIIRRISLIINREENFIDKHTNMLLLEENSHYSHFQSSKDVMYKIDLSNNSKGGLIWSNYDDIRVKVEFYSNINKDVDVFIILENQNILRFTNKICGLEFS